MSTTRSARLSVVIYSLAITAFLMIFLALAQPLGLRFDYAKQENLRLIDVLLPTFLGYLGSCAHFIFNSEPAREIDAERKSLLTILVHAPFIIFGLFTAALFFTHYVTHRPLPDDAPRVDPLTYDTLSRYLSLGLGLLAGTVGIISSYLFGTQAPSQANPSIKSEKDGKSDPG